VLVFLLFLLVSILSIVLAEIDLDGVVFFQSLIGRREALVGLEELSTRL
jgi:hypothetical protein